MARRRIAPPPPPPRSLVASAKRADLSDGKAAKRVLANRTKAQSDAWDFYDLLSEVSFPAIWVGALLQKVEFYAATWDADGKSVVRVESPSSPFFETAMATQAVHEMSRLRLTSGGQGEMNRLAAMNLEVAGEFNLWCRNANPSAIPPEPEVWDVLSVRELEPKQVTEGEPAVYVVKRSPDDKGEETRPDDAIIRVWQRHPAWGHLATSSLMSALTDCDTLLTLSQELRAQSKSRQMAGVFRVPTELNLTITRRPGEEVDDDAPKPFDEQLADAFITPVEDPNDASAVVPMVVSGPAEFLKPDCFGWSSMGRTTDPSTDDRMDKLTHRIARGVHLPVEVLLGHMSTTFSNAEQIGQDKFDEYIDPRCRTLADAYGAGFLTPQLLAAKQAGAAISDDQIGQVFVWYDPSAVIGSPDPTKDATELWTDGLISDAAMRRFKGIDEFDAASPNERAAAIALKKGSLDTTQTAALLRLAGVPVPDPEPAAPAAEPATAALMSYLAGRLDTIAGAATPQHPARAHALDAVVAARSGVEGLGRKLVDLDRRLRERVHGAVEVAVERCLERAGAKLRGDRALRQQVARAVDNTRVASMLGPVIVSSAGYTVESLTDEAWAKLREPFVRWCVQTSMDAYDAVVRASRRDASPARRASHEARARRGAEDGYDQLVADLNALLERFLFAPDADPDSFTRVPLSVVRRALRVAGGWSGMHAVTAAQRRVVDDEDDDEEQPARSRKTAAAPSAPKPVGDVALGEWIMDTIDAEGFVIDGFMWVYGSSERSFEPHLGLDGVEFQNFDSPELENPDGFPNTPYYYPGDHEGCGCDFEPTIIEGGL